MSLVHLTLQAEGDGEKARWPSWACTRPHWASVSYLYIK